MLFVDTNSHLTTKTYDFDIKCQSNSESYDQHGLSMGGGQNLPFTLGGFPNKRECSMAYWLEPLLHITGVEFMANKQFRMEKELGTTVCADISHYAL